MDPILDEPFTLTFKVEQLNVKPGVPALPAVWTAGVTPRHRVGDLREMVWHQSEDNHLKPVFFTFRLHGERVDDNATLQQLFFPGAAAPAAYELDLTMVVDYTLWGSPAIPNRQPQPVYFDVVVRGHGDKKYVFRESIASSVENMRETIAAREELPLDEVELMYRGQPVGPTVRLGEALHLTAPPLVLVELTFRATFLAEVNAVHITDGTATTVRVHLDQTMHDLKLALGRSVAHPALALNVYFQAHLISPSLLQPDKRSLREFFGGRRINIGYACTGQWDLVLDGERWALTGNLYVQVQNEKGEVRMVEQGAFAGETYDVEMDGATVSLLTAECVIDGDRAYVGPTGIAKLAQHWSGAIYSNLPGKSLLTNVATGTDEAATDEAVTSVDTEIDSGAATDSGMTRIDSTETEIDLTRQATDLPTEPAPTPTEPENGNAQDRPLAEQLVEQFAEQIAQAAAANAQAHLQPNAGLLHRLAVAAENHAAVFRDRIVDAVVTMFLFGFYFGFDAFSQFWQPSIMAALGVLGLLTALFFYSEHIARWINHHLLDNAPHGRLEFAIVRGISRGFQFAHYVSQTITDGFMHAVTASLDRLHYPRHMWMERECLGEIGPVQRVQKAACNCVEGLVLYMALVWPVEAVLDEYFQARRNREALLVVSRCEQLLRECEHWDDNGALRRALERVLAKPAPEILRAETADNAADLLRCYCCLLKLHQQRRGLQQARGAAGSRARGTAR